jgi:hypothetical protein
MEFFEVFPQNLDLLGAGDDAAVGTFPDGFQVLRP